MKRHNTVFSSVFPPHIIPHSEMLSDLSGISMWMMRIDIFKSYEHFKDYKLYFLTDEMKNRIELQPENVYEAFGEPNEYYGRFEVILACQMYEIMIKIHRVFSNLKAQKITMGENRPAISEDERNAIKATIDTSECVKTQF